MDLAELRVELSEDAVAHVGGVRLHQRCQELAQLHAEVCGAVLDAK